MPEQDPPARRAPRISGVTVPVRPPTPAAVPPGDQLIVSLYAGEHQLADHVALPAALHTLADLVRIRAGHGDRDIGGLAVRVHSDHDEPTSEHGPASG